MDSNEAAFLAKLLATFKIEAEEHLKNITEGLLTLEKKPPETQYHEIIETIYRESHSLKGAARAVNQKGIEEICQNLEDVLSSLKQNKIHTTEFFFETVYSTVDLIRKYIFSNEKELDESQLYSLIQNLFLLNEGKEETKQRLKPAKSLKIQKKDKPPPKNKQTKPKKIPSPLVSRNVSKLESISPEQESTEKIPVQEIKTDKTIRVSLQKLDKLLQQLEEILIIKITSSQRLTELRDLQNSLILWKKQWDSIHEDIKTLKQHQKNRSMSLNKQFRLSKQFFDFISWQENFIKTNSDNINKLLSKSVQDHRFIGGMIDNLIDDTKKVLMQPFATLLEILPRMVRDISHAQNKDVHFEMQGTDIEIDRRILEEMKDPIIHIIRNSIDHGIESIKEREKLKKTPYGTLKITIFQVSGNSVEIHIIDDGQGIDIEKVKKSAIKQGLYSEKEINDLSEEQCRMLIFQSGISTSPIITEFSGRGIGLGVVSEKVEKLGGQVLVSSEPNIGTTFKIILPLTLATFRGIHVQASNQDFIIPTHHMKRVIRIKPQAIKTIENRQAISFEGHTLAYIHLRDLLELPSSVIPKQKFIIVLIIKALETTACIGVDKIVTEKEVFAKSLGRQLSHVKNIAAATIMDWGKVIPILDPFDLIKTVIKKSASTELILAPQDLEKKEKKKILVVEDSITARILLKNILDSAGYHVKTAVDGIEAYSMLKSEKIDLVLSDIEMPRMDGLELTKKIRDTEPLKDLPIILCTSRGSEEDRKHGIESGANAYIAKSNFVQSNLLDIIQKLL